MSSSCVKKQEDWFCEFGSPVGMLMHTYPEKLEFWGGRRAGGVFGEVDARGLFTWETLRMVLLVSSPVGRVSGQINLPACRDGGR